MSVTYAQTVETWEAEQASDLVLSDGLSVSGTYTTTRFFFRNDKWASQSRQKVFLIIWLIQHQQKPIVIFWKLREHFERVIGFELERKENNQRSRSPWITNAYIKFNGAVAIGKILLIKGRFLRKKLWKIQIWGQNFEKVTLKGRKFNFQLLPF
jgi:hypothetical protein